MAELDRARIAAVLAADAQLNVRTGGAAQFGSHFDQLADALLIQLGKGIRLVDLVIIISVEELAGVVAVKPKVI